LAIDSARAALAFSPAVGVVVADRVERGAGQVLGERAGAEPIAHQAVDVVAERRLGQRSTLGVDLLTAGREGRDPREAQRAEESAPPKHRVGNLAEKRDSLDGTPASRRVPHVADFPTNFTWIRCLPA
jgi:hypothetical protein